MNWGDELVRGSWENAAWLNQLAFTYTPEILIPRFVMVLFAAACLAVLYTNFSIAERMPEDRPSNLQALHLTNGARFHHDTEGFLPLTSLESETTSPAVDHREVTIPRVIRKTSGPGGALRQLLAAVGIEMRLLRSEKV